MKADFPLPGAAAAVVAIAAPAPRPGYWAGCSSAVLDDDGSYVMAYRTRMGNEARGSVVVTRSHDGEQYREIVRLEQARFGAASMERPALARTDEGTWRLYVCCATPGTKHWWIDLLEADRPEGLETSERCTVFPGDEHVGVKDPVILRRDGGWEAWICCHPLDEPGEEDRMTTAYAVSDDGIAWRIVGTALAPSPGRWDSRGTRVTVVLPDGRAAYDGRATKEENFLERTGLAMLTDERDGLLEQLGDGPVADVRYLDVLPLPAGGYRIWYEARLDDGSHELRTELHRRA